MTGITRSTAQPTSRVAPSAGDGLLNAPALLAIVVLIVNDHVLKAALPGLVTGKLSDFAGLLFFPLFVQALGEVCWSAAGRWRGPRRTALIASMGLAAIVFAAIKTVPVANAAVAALLGTAQWAVGLLVAAPGSAPRPVPIALDPTDLAALPVLAVTYMLGMRRIDTAESKTYA